MKPLDPNGAWTKTLIETSPLSETFKVLAKQKGLLTIGDIMQIELTELSTDEWITPTMMDELTELLDRFRNEQA